VDNVAYAFKKSGLHGEFDLVDDFDICEYVASLPSKREPINDVDDFKEFSAQYFTPSNLKSGLSRDRSNIKDIQAIVIDLDKITDWKEFLTNFYVLYHNTTKMNVYAWQTPSTFGKGKHIGGGRIYVPLAEPIIPELLPQAVDELVVAFAKSGFNLLDYGADLVASKTISRLMGLPLQQEWTLGPFGDKDRFNYRVKSVYTPTSFKSNFKSASDGWSGVDIPTEIDIEAFIQAYTTKNHITWNHGERDDNLMKVIGAIATAFSQVNNDDVYKAFEGVGITSCLDHPERDIGTKTKRLLRG
jgi:hypothetical protein